MGVVILVVIILFFVLCLLMKVTNSIKKTQAKSRGWNKCASCKKRLVWDKQKMAYATVCAKCGRSQAPRVTKKQAGRQTT